MTGNRANVASGQQDNCDKRSAGQALVALRAATRALHAQIDVAMPLALHGRHSIVEYSAHLHLLQDWLSPYPQWFCDIDDDCTRYAQVVSTQLSAIALDLADIALSARPSTARREQLLGMAPSTAYRWGAAYVIEGSSLGAAALHAQIGPMLRSQPLRYLGGDGQSRAGRWREFISTLEARVCTPVQIADCCSGARAAFEAMLHLLDKDSGRATIQSAT